VWYAPDVAKRNNTPPRARAKTTRGRTTNPDDLKWCRAFLAAFAKTGSVTDSMRLARVTPYRAYELRKESPEFARLWIRAKHAFRDRLRNEAQKRAVEGWLEPVFQQGKKVGQVRKKSDQILLAMLRSNCKEYRERVDLSVTIREQAKKLAEKSGFNEAELVAVAERIAKGEEMP